MNDVNLQMSSRISMSSSKTVAKTVDGVVNWQLIVLASLFVSIVFIAIKTVVHRHEARSLFVEMQKLEKERDVLAAQWSRLKLEQGTVLNQVTVERQARWDLGMKMPKTSEIKMIREPVNSIFVKDQPQLDVPLNKSNKMKIRVSLGD